MKGKIVLAGEVKVTVTVTVTVQCRAMDIYHSNSAEQVQCIPGWMPKSYEPDSVSIFIFNSNI